MTNTNLDQIRVELKYCERCGGLWFRRENCREVLCAPCTLDSARTALGSGDDARQTVPPRKQPASADASAWYGPTTSVVKRLQGVAQGGVA